MPAQLEQTHLAIEAYPVGLRGQIALRVRTTCQLWEGDRPESQNQAIIEILSMYARPKRFAGDLGHLISVEDSEAVLEVEKLT